MMIKAIFLYEKLFELLRSVGVDALIDYVNERDINENARKALRILATLPDPRTVSTDEAKFVARECITGYLEFAYGREGIGDIARELARILEIDNEEDHLLSSIVLAKRRTHTWFHQDFIEHQLDQQLSMLSRIGAGVSRLEALTDIDLKAQCPHCHGPLVEVLVDVGSPMRELRLRCKDQTESSCQTSDWFIQNVDKRNP